MGKNDGAEIIKKIVAELSRVGAAMISIFVAFWFFAQPAAEKFVIEVIDAQNLAPSSDVAELKSAVKDIQADQKDLDRDVAAIGSKLDSIEKLAQEQRAMQTQILLRLGGAPPQP